MQVHSPLQRSYLNMNRMKKINLVNKIKKGKIVKKRCGGSSANGMYVSIKQSF